MTGFPPSRAIASGPSPVWHPYLEEGGVRPVTLAIVALPFALYLTLCGPNVALAAYAFLVLALVSSLTVRLGGPPILGFVALLQWAQAGLGPIYANYNGVKVEDLSLYPGSGSLACFLLLTGVLVLAVGMRLGSGPKPHHVLASIRASAASRPLGFWLRFFAICWLIGTIAESVAYQSGPLLQPLIALAQIKWAGFMLLTYATFAVKGRPMQIWLAVFALQFALSLGGFFSNFKDVFFYAILGVLACSERLNGRQIMLGLLALAALIGLGVVWTAVKADYRSFVNDGTGDQVVLVEYSDQVGELKRLTSNLDERDIERGFENMAKRIMYYDIFGVVLDFVPDREPHAGGTILAQAITSPLMPRFLFPDKPAVNDSELTNTYTDLNVFSFEQGTSISIGYIGEAYIDFGIELMFLPVFAIGLIMGRAYRWLVSGSGLRTSLGSALACSSLVPLSFLENSMLKLVPSLALVLLTCFILLRVSNNYLKSFH